MFSLSGNVQMKALGFEEWMKREMCSLWIAFRSFSCKLTSDSSLPFGKRKRKRKKLRRFVLSSPFIKMLQKASSELWQQGSRWPTDYSPCIKLEMINMILGGGRKKCLSLLLTLPHIYGNWGVRCKKKIILKMQHRRKLSSNITAGLYLGWWMTRLMKIRMLCDPY